MPLSRQGHSTAQRTPFAVLETRWRRVASTHTLQVRQAGSHGGGGGGAGGALDKMLACRHVTCNPMRATPCSCCRTCSMLTTLPKRSAAPASNYLRWGARAAGGVLGGACLPVPACAPSAAAAHARACCCSVRCLGVHTRRHASCPARWDLTPLLQAAAHRGRGGQPGGGHVCHRGEGVG